MHIWCMGLPKMVAEFHAPLPREKMYIGRLTLKASQLDDDCAYLMTIVHTPNLH